MIEEMLPLPPLERALMERIFASSSCDVIASTIWSPCPLPSNILSINDIRSMTFGPAFTPVSISAIIFSFVFADSVPSFSANAAIGFESAVNASVSVFSSTLVSSAALMIASGSTACAFAR